MLAPSRTMSLALGGLPSMLPQDKLAELKETAAKLCAPGRVKTCETLDSIDSIDSQAIEIQP